MESRTSRSIVLVFLSSAKKAIKTEGIQENMRY